jgi:multiple sugar transport system substrate-binding protein
VLLCLTIAPGAAFAETTVRMWTFLDPSKPSPRDSALKTMIDSFEKSHPGVKIKVEPQVYTQLSMKFMLGHKTGSSADVVFVNTSDLGMVMRSGAAADLQALFIGKWPKGEDEDFYIRAGWDAALKDGKRFAVPLFHGTEAIFYRKDLFEAAGVDMTRVKTWDAFAEAARKVTRDGVWGFGTPLAANNPGAELESTMIVSGQGDAWNRETCRPDYATPTGIRTVDWVADLINKHKVMPKEALVATSDDIHDQFSAGRYAAILGAFARFSKAQDEATWDKTQLRILPFPNFSADKPGSHRVAGWWAVVWSKSPQIKEAGQWVEHMISKEGVTTWSKIGGQVPTRSSVLADPAFQTAAFEHVRTIHAAWSASSWILPVNCNTQRFDGELNTAVHRVTLGEADAKAALSEAEKLFRERQ